MYYIHIHAVWFEHYQSRSPNTGQLGKLNVRHSGMSLMHSLFTDAQIVIQSHASRHNEKGTQYVLTAGRQRDADHVSLSRRPSSAATMHTLRL